jgi:hypothetical protein
VWPLESEAEARTARTLLGLGDEPGYVALKGSKWASIPADGLGTAGQGRTLGDATDAVVYHGDVPDSVVHADLSVLKAKYRVELERRTKLLGEAFELWRSRGAGEARASRPWSTARRRAQARSSGVEA